jgi:hypothetical protein
VPTNARPPLMTVIGWVATLPGWPLCAVGASITPTTVLTPGVFTPRVPAGAGI